MKHQGLDEQELRRSSFEEDRFESLDYKRYREDEKIKFDTKYEKWANKLGSIKKIDLSNIPFSEKGIKELEKDLRISRIKLSQEEIGSLLFLPLFIVLPILAILTIFLPTPLRIIAWTMPFIWSYWVITYPNFKATVKKIKSSDEALKIILYMAMQIKINPNLEKGLKSASDHTDGPLSKDISKILWDLETNKYTTAKKAIAKNMKFWRDWSAEFVKSLKFLMDAIGRVGESKKRMIQTSQESIIKSTKNKMSRYVQNLETPIKLVHMAGIVLPLMGLIMFPLISIFLNDGRMSIGGLSFYMGFGYIVVLPLLLFFIVKRIISKRPGAYAHPSLKNVRNLPPKDKLLLNIGGNKYYLPLKQIAILVAVTIMIPGLLYYTNLISTIAAYETSIDVGQGQITSQEWQDFVETQYEIENVVPNVLKSMTIFWGISIGLIIYFGGKSFKRKKIREKIKEIEENLEIGLSGLEGSLSKEMPLERALYNVVDDYQTTGEGDTPTSEFFQEVLQKVERSSTPFEKAVFGKKIGAIWGYPSDILENSMKIVTNSIMHGTQSLANNIRTIINYIRNKNDIEQMINNLLSSTVNQMKIQANFIAPVITAAAASMSLLIIQVLYGIARQLEAIEQQIGLGNGADAGGGLANQIALVQNLDSAVPPTIMLLIVSMYLILVSLILAYFTNGIENGFDEINRDIMISKTLMYAGVLFTFLVLVASVYVTPMLTTLG